MDTAARLFRTLISFALKPSYGAYIPHFPNDDSAKNCEKVKMSIEKLGKCQVCQEAKAKYRCPRCATVSCSLHCSKAHKRLNNFCDGVRDKTKLVPLKHFTAIDLKSDLSLLEDAARYSAEKDAKPIKAPTEKQKRSSIHPKAFEALQRACWRRNKCKLHALPSHFSRHLSNTTCHVPVDDEIFWKISWIVPHHVKNLIHSDRISERSRLLDLLLNIFARMDKEVKEAQFSYYKMHPLKDFCVLLKLEGGANNDENFVKQRYLHLEPEHSLAWNLQGQNIVEHPIIVIVHKDHSSLYLDGGDIREITDLLIDEEPTSKPRFEALNFHSDQEETVEKMSPEAGKKSFNLSSLVSYPSSDDEI